MNIEYLIDSDIIEAFDLMKVFNSEEFINEVIDDVIMNTIEDDETVKTIVSLNEYLQLTIQTVHI